MPNDAMIRIGADPSGAIKGFDAAGKSADQYSEKIKGMGSEFANMAKQALVFFGVWKTASEMKEFIESSTMLSARVETLGVVMEQVGRTAGYSSAEVNKFADGVKAMGITTEESRNTVVRMIQAHLDLTKSAQIARVAQDAAVIGNVNSSEALQRIMHGITTLQPEILRTIGIIVNFEEAYKRVAAQMGRTADSLSPVEKQSIALNLVLERGADIAGSYEAAMGTVGKQLTSLPRYIDEVKLRFGEAFKPALGVIIGEVASALGLAQKNMDTIATSNAIKSFGANLASNVQSAINVLKYFGEIAAWVGKTLYYMRDAIIAVSVALASRAAISFVTAAAGASNLLWYLRNIGFVLEYLKVTAILPLLSPMGLLTGTIAALTFGVLKGREELSKYNDELLRAKGIAAGFTTPGQAMEEITNLAGYILEMQENIRKAEATVRKTPGSNEAREAMEYIVGAKRNIEAAEIRQEEAQKRLKALNSENLALEQARQRAAEGSALARTEEVSSTLKKLAEETRKSGFEFLPKGEQIDAEAASLREKLQIDAAKKAAGKLPEGEDKTRALRDIAERELALARWTEAEKTKLRETGHRKVLDDLASLGKSETELVLLRGEQMRREGVSEIDTETWIQGQLGEIRRKGYIDAMAEATESYRQRQEAAERFAGAAAAAEVQSRIKAVEGGMEQDRARQSVGLDSRTRTEQVKAEYEARRKILDLKQEELLLSAMYATDEGARQDAARQYADINAEIIRLGQMEAIDVYAAKIEQQRVLNELKQAELDLTVRGIDASMQYAANLAPSVEGSREAMQGFADIGAALVQGQDPVFADLAARSEAHYAEVDEKYRQGLATREEADTAFNSAVVANEQAQSMNKVQIASSTFGTLGSLAQAFYSASGEKSKAAFNLMKGFQVAETVINTYKSAVAAYSALAGIPFVGPALGAAAAAAAIAFGMMQVKNIMSQKPGGATGSPSVPSASTPSITGGGATPPPVAEEAKKPTEQIINVHVYGNIVDHDKFARELVPSLVKLQEDRAIT